MRYPRRILVVMSAVAGCIWGAGCVDNGNAREDDRAALEALYNATGGPHWSRNDNWLTAAPLGDWYGVDMDAEGRVVVLALPLNNLSGPIPPELGGLANLTDLNLGGNDLTGPIPRELDDLANLADVNLSGNDLTKPSCEEWNTEEFFRNATGVVVKHCLDRGADVNAWDRREDVAPLHLASQFGTPQQIKVLVDAGADVNARAKPDWETGGAGWDQYIMLGWTPLHVAAVLGSPANVEALIDAGANATGDVLLWAAARGTPANLKALVDAGVELEGGLHAATDGDPDNIGVLLEAGADIEARDVGGRTPLHQAAGGWDSEATRSHIEILIKAGADIEARNEGGRTPLHLSAAWDGDADRVEALVEAGAELEARDENGWTPLHLAASMRYDGLSSGSPAALDALLRMGANAEAQDDEGQTPLHVAALHPEGEWGKPGSQTKIGVLLAAGADIEARNGRGRTPLHLAAGIEYGGWEFDYLSILLDAGASVEARDEDGRTPLDIAAGSTATDVSGPSDNVVKLMLAPILFADTGTEAGAGRDRAITTSTGWRIVVADGMGAATRSGRIVVLFADEEEI